MNYDKAKWEVCEFTGNEGERALSVMFRKTGDGVDFYAGEGEMEWVDGNSLIANDEDGGLIAEARRIGAAWEKKTYA